MASTALSISSPELLAEYVRESELKTSIREKRLTAPPDHMAMLIRDGRIVDTYKGAHFSIGGVFKSLKTLVTGSSYISILLADLKPFSVAMEVNALSQDNVAVQGIATFELQVDPDKPANIMGFVSPEGCLSRTMVLQRLRPHIQDRGIESAVGRVPATSIRGDKAIQDLIQGQIMAEVARVAGDIGMTVRAVSLEWGITETEVHAMQQSALDREQDRLDNDLSRLKRSIDRSSDSTRFQIEADVDLQKLKSASEEELQLMTLNSEVRLLDARENAQRRQELEALSHEVEVLQKERVAKFENQLAELDHSMDVAGRQSKLQKMNNDLDKMNQTHQIEMDKMSQVHQNEMKTLTANTDRNIHVASGKADIDLQDGRNVSSRTHISGLQQIELDGEKVRTDLEINKNAADVKNAIALEKAKADAQLAELKAAASMKPEQILAIKAGLSSEVAGVLAEQARSNSAGNEQAMSLMREMVTQATDARVATEQQARDMFQMGMQGAAGVAHGAGGKTAPAGAIGSTATVIECGSCGRENVAKAKFCVGCGKKMRV